MPEILVAVSVTRDELSLPDLELNDTLNDGPFRVIRAGLGPGPSTVRLGKTSSEVVDGDFIYAYSLETVVMPLAIRVTGEDASEVNSNIELLVAAFRQLSYQLTFSVEGAPFSYICQPAQISYGAEGVIQEFHMKARQQEVRFQIPRHPSPVAGPL